MKKYYDVIVRRIVHETAVLTVVAGSRREARIAAQYRLNTEHFAIWEYERESTHIDTIEELDEPVAEDEEATRVGDHTHD